MKVTEIRVKGIHLDKGQYWKCGSVGVGVSRSCGGGVTPLSIVHMKSTFSLRYFVATFVIMFIIVLAFCSRPSVAGRPTYGVTDIDSKHIMMVSLSLRGHVVPLARLATELIFRGHRVSFAVPPDAKEQVDACGAQMIPLRLPHSPEHRRAHLIQISYDTSFFRGILNLMNEIYLPNAQPMFAALSQVVKQENPDILVIDIGTLGAVEVAHFFKIPYIINNPSISLRFDSGTTYFPGMNRRTSLLSRCLALLVPRLMAIAFTPTFMDINNLRYQHALPLYKGQYEMFGKSITMVNTALGFDYASVVSPLTKFVGPLLPTMKPLLTSSLSRWLDRNTKPVVLILTGKGSMAYLEPWLVNVIAEAVSDTRFRVLWALRAEDANLVKHKLPTTSRVVSNLPQLAVTVHAAVKVVVSPCGISTAQEALYNGKSLLCIPILGDQSDVAARVVDAGVGIIMDKQTLKAEEMKSNILTLLKTESFENNAQRIGTILRAAGGTHAAADLVEFTAQAGIDHLLPANQALNWHETNYIDVFAVIVAILCILVVLLRFVGLIVVAGVHSAHALVSGLNTVTEISSTDENNRASAGTGRSPAAATGSK